MFLFIMTALALVYLDDPFSCSLTRTIAIVGIASQRW